jgi:hypothetical protein
MTQPLKPEEAAANMLRNYGYAKAYQRASEYMLDAKWAEPRRVEAQDYWAAVTFALTALQIRRTWQ